MKTRELIRQLQETDPSGDLECCVGNADILAVWAEPAYWDGCLQVLVRDPTSQYYNVVGARYQDSGVKVVIQPHSICDALLEDPEMPVDTSAIARRARERYEAQVAEWRQTMRDINESVERKIFVAYMVRRLAEHYGEDFSEEEVTGAAARFFDESLSRRDPMPEDLQALRNPDGSWPSWSERRSRQWDREIAVAFEGARLELRLNREASDDD